MISGSLSGIADMLDRYATISKLPIIGDLVGGLLPMSGSLRLVSGSAEPIGSVAGLFADIGS